MRHEPARTSIDEARDAERRADVALAKASATRETAAKLRDAAARSLAGYLVDHLADLARLTAEYAARRAAWSEADEEYNRAFEQWMRAYEQRKRLEDDDLEGGGSGA